VGHNAPLFFIMKRDKNFKLDRQTKQIVETILDPLKRSQFKDAMIEAQISASIIPVKTEKKNKNEPSEE